MAAVLERLSEAYSFVVQSGDPRGNQYPLVSTPIPIIVTVGLYVTFTQYGPRYFQHRAPMRLKPLIIIYNFCMVMFSAYMFKEFVLCSYLGSYNFTCQPMDYSWNPTAMRMVRVCWLFYISKPIELADTVFIVVRKKGDLSFLHVYHHASVVLLQWILIKYIPSGHSTFQALFNCFVHTIMYLYYLMSSFPNLKRYLWWKKYLTILQMIQFVCITTHIIVGIYHKCEYPRVPAYICFFECGILFVLFGNYYIQTYLKKQKAAMEKANKAM